MTGLREALWRRAVGLVEPLSERALQGQVARGEIPQERASERRGVATMPAPGGPIVWLHARGLSRALDLTGVMARLWEEHGEVDILMTTRQSVDEGALSRRLPVGVLHQFLPLDRPAAIDRFLDHWKPQLCLWSDGPDPAVALSAITARGVPLCLLPGDTLEAWVTRRTRSRLRQAARIFAEDTAALARLRESGAPARSTLITGLPREDAMAPEIDSAERDRLARSLEGRPVWLAAGVPDEERSLVLAAHRAAKPLVPRLALILLPSEPGEMPAFERNLSTEGLSWTRASELGPDNAEPEVILADPATDSSLWYQLATVSFIGGSLIPFGGQSPQTAAALGSAVLYGPHTGYFADLFERLKTAGAARLVQDADELGQTVAQVIEPGVAADMAHRAWHISSEGAEATDAIVGAMSDVLDGVDP